MYAGVVGWAWVRWDRAFTVAGGGTGGQNVGGDGGGEEDGQEDGERGARRVGGRDEGGDRDRGVRERAGRGAGRVKRVVGWKGKGRGAMSGRDWASDWKAGLGVAMGYVVVCGIEGVVAGSVVGGM